MVLLAPAGSTGTRTFTGSAIVRADGTAYDLPLPVISLPRISPPSIDSQPVSRTVAVGSVATFSVVVPGPGPFTYAWSFNNAPLTDGAGIAGSSTASLTISNVGSANAGSYKCTVTNDAGPTDSSSATLTVVNMTAAHALAGSGYTPGGTVGVSNTFTHANLTGVLKWSVLLPAGWTLKSSSGDDNATRPTAGRADLLEWTWTTPPTSPFTFGYVLQAPVTSTGDKALSALVELGTGDAKAQITAKPEPLVVPLLALHSADTDSNNQINLFELTRVIELYNTRRGGDRTGRYAVAQTPTDDGFVSDPVAESSAVITLSRYHSADSNQDGKIDLRELTRVIELYNTRTGTTRTGRYRVQAGSEDGFAPFP